MVTYTSAMDDLFRALGDPTRRRILDLLRERDGMTVSDLDARIALSRFGVMKHLAVLEEAGLVVARRDGRYKHIHLNAAPIQQIADRWIAPFVQPWASMTSALKQHVEKENEMTTQSDFVLETYIRATPERIWAALTSPEDTRAYYFGSEVHSDFRPGSPIRYMWPEDKLMLDGRVIEADPPRKLVTTFRPHWGEGEPRETEVMFTIEPAGDAAKLTIVHKGLIAAEDGIRTGWMKIMSGLKTLLETDKPLMLEAA